MVQRLSVVVLLVLVLPFRNVSSMIHSTTGTAHRTLAQSRDVFLRQRCRPGMNQNDPMISRRLTQGKQPTKMYAHNGHDSHNERSNFESPLTTPPATNTNWQRRYDKLMAASALSLAPMMEYTDRHFRHLVRLVSDRTLLYTEMVAANALSHERRERMNDYWQTHPDASFDEVRQNYPDQYLQRYLVQGHVAPLEGASVLQLGGSNPDQMFEAAQTVMDFTARGHCDYTAMNLNCGCPSPKVAGKGCFGAALMDEPHLVAQLTKALHEGCDGQMPVTVKCRIGTDTTEAFTKQGYEAIDTEQEYQRLCHFIETVAADGIVTDFSVHARIAVLRKSFSPNENRKIPPLKYDTVRRLVTDYPELTFTLNGGVDTLPQARRELDRCPQLNGVMIGRAWAADPWSFAMADSTLYNDTGTKSYQYDGSSLNSFLRPRNRLEVLQAYGRHADAEEARGDPERIRRFIVKAVMPLFTGEPHSKRYRIALDEIARIPKQLANIGKTLEGQPPLSESILQAAMEHLGEEVLLRSREESYMRLLHDQAKETGESLSAHSPPGERRSKSVAAWQTMRKEEDNNRRLDDAMDTAFHQSAVSSSAAG